MDTSHLLELLTILCFGISWPFSVWKTYKTKSTQGKSLVFLLAIFIGYVIGIINKLFFSYNYAFWAYLLNIILVGMELVLYFVYRKREKQAASK